MVAPANSASAVAYRSTTASRARISSDRKGRVNGPRWCACRAPSSESMLGPTTFAVENRGSSTVNLRASRMTWTASSYPVTSQAPRTGTQLTGEAARKRASTGCGSASRTARVTACAADPAAITGRCPGRSCPPLRVRRPGGGRGGRHNGAKIPRLCYETCDRRAADQPTRSPGRRQQTGAAASLAAGHGGGLYWVLAATIVTSFSDLLVDRQDDEVSDVDVAGSGQHVEHGVGHVLGPQPGSRCDAVRHRGRVRHLPQVVQDDTGRDGSDPHSGPDQLAPDTVSQRVNGVLRRRIHRLPGDHLVPGDRAGDHDVSAPGGDHVLECGVHRSHDTAHVRVNQAE